MEESSATASAVISYTQKLEGDSAAFYSRMASTYPEQGALFLSFSADSMKNRALIARTYQETVTDALETGYSFAGLTFRDLLPHIEEGAPVRAAIEASVKLEKEAVAFYSDLRERSRTLLSTISGAFGKVGAKRATRIARLESLAGAQG